jgi:Carboxypeptidase regulatory-like domain
MKRSDSLFRVAGKVVLLSCSFAGFSVVTPVVSLYAQQRGPVQRVVQGRVMDKSEALLQGAVVYLKDGHSLAVKSFISNDQGAYRFGQLSQNTDYEIWAEHDGKKSQVKTISSFDSKNQIFIDLKIDTGK